MPGSQGHPQLARAWTRCGVITCTCAVYKALGSPRTAHDVSLGLSKDSKPRMRGPIPRQPPRRPQGRGGPRAMPGLPRPEDEGRGSDAYSSSPPQVTLWLEILRCLIFLGHSPEASVTCSLRPCLGGGGVLRTIAHLVLVPLVSGAGSLPRTPRSFSWLKT